MAEQSLAADRASKLQELPSRPWHALDRDTALMAFDTRTDGLTEAEAGRRMARFGGNRLPQAVRRGWFVRLLAQFHNVLIYVLLASAVLAFVLDHVIDAAVILGVVLVNAVIGFIQEGRAEQALEAIRAMIDPKATVLRDGHRVTVPADQIVPGDIVIIEAGDRVSADLRMIRARNLRIEEAVLTGESVAVEKSVDPVREDAALGDRTSMAYSGTFVAAGHGTGIVVATGLRTELGRISELIGAVETLKTPLIKRMDVFAQQLTAVVLALSALTFLFAWYARGYSVSEAFMIVVGLAVSAIPEGLPAILTITLAIGVRRMAARNAIIRRLPAVETLGSVSVICSDKTGTLTRNEMTVRRMVTAERAFDVSGVGYEPKGELQAHGRAVDPEDDPVVMQLVRAALLCNDAELHRSQQGAESTWAVNGDPMEGALVVLAMKAGLDPDAVRKQLPRVDEIPFDAAHRFMATLHRSHDNDVFAFIKGAPERVLEMCGREQLRDSVRSLESDVWRRRADELASEGHRVLAFAMKGFAGDKHALDFDDVERDAEFLGIVGFIDPPRIEAIEAIRDCKSAGIRVVMITGDHVVTAREIGRQLGLPAESEALTGRDLEQLDAAALRARARDVSVFARTTPEHKLRLVEALQSEGAIVAMTGDGVNDAPALKRADVGVAMGENGTEAAKQAAEMVLADDNFASIVHAVREGRTVYDNILKVIAWTLPTNGGEALTILAALAMGLALPITPAQILWINMITAVALGLTLAFEPTEPGVMRRVPRPADEPILSLNLLWRIGFVSALFVSGAFGLFFWAEARGEPIEVARTLVVNAIVVMEIFYLFSVRYVHGTSLTWQGVLGTPAVLWGVGTVVVAQLAFTYTPLMNTVFYSRALSVREGAAVIGVGLVLLILVELEKAVARNIGAVARKSQSNRSMAER
ncbi:MAG TPA: cation-transporting P-type ATPase [Steroidobacteraceae bacterium]|nr:cation-transporting P-type ATPase [Steroidobacteraceae bacterium]